MCDGLAIINKAAKLGDSSIGSQRIDAEAAFNKCFPFVPGGDNETTKKAANELIAKFKRTALWTASQVDPIAFRRMLISKFPREPKRLGYKADKWDVTLGVRNLADVKPPQISAQAGYNRVGNAPLYSGYDYFGRTVYLNLTTSF